MEINRQIEPINTVSSDATEKRAKYWMRERMIEDTYQISRQKMRKWLRYCVRTRASGLWISTSPLPVRANDSSSAEFRSAFIAHYSSQISLFAHEIFQIWSVICIRFYTPQTGSTIKWFRYRQRYAVKITVNAFHFWRVAAAPSRGRWRYAK